MAQYLQGQPGVAFTDKAGNVHPAWAAWLTTAHQILQDTSASGTTTQRPTNQLYIGKPYFDTTIGMSIQVASVNPTVWVNGVGAAV